jgi:hypothetical protein
MESAIVRPKKLTDGAIVIVSQSIGDGPLRDVVSDGVETPAVSRTGIQCIGGLGKMTGHAR